MLLIYVTSGWYMLCYISYKRLIGYYCCLNTKLSGHCLLQLKMVQRALPQTNTESGPQFVIEVYGVLGLLGYLSQEATQRLLPHCNSGSSQACVRIVAEEFEGEGCQRSEHDYDSYLPIEAAWRYLFIYLFIYLLCV